MKGGCPLIQASEQFHNALRQAALPKQRALVRFGNAIFENGDMNIGAGISFLEAINPETDLAIGACPSASLEFTLFNKDLLLRDFEFGEHTASLGVLVDSYEFSVEQGANVTVKSDWWGDGEIVFSGHDMPPYLTENGAECAVQPSFPVKSIFIDNGLIYCFGEDAKHFFAALRSNGSWRGMNQLPWQALSLYPWDEVKSKRYFVLTPSSGTWDSLSAFTWEALRPYTWNELANANIRFNAFMLQKIANAVAMNRGWVINQQYETEFYGDMAEVYEHVPLGTFVAATPEKVLARLISVKAQDRMLRFDIDAKPFIDTIRYPITIRQLLTRLCSFVGVRDIPDKHFINSGRILKEEPPGFTDVTAREILKWIAEAACGYAKFDRYGQLQLTWYATTPMQLDEDNCEQFSAAEYRVAKIDKIQVRNSDSDIGTIIGDGENAYVITDNPMLYSDTELEGKLATAPLFDRLNAIPSLYPCDASVFADWSIEAGDIISIANDGDTYQMPIYSQSLQWTGAAKATYEFTGTDKREPVSETNRRFYSQGKASYELKTGLEGLSSVAVRKDGVVSSINQSPEQITIQAGKISLEGLVTVNRTFKINEDGSMEATGGKIAGWNINSSAIYRGNSTFGAAGGQYFGTSGISLSDKFTVTSAGALTATSGSVGGWSLTNNSIYRGTNTLGTAGAQYFGVSGISLSDKFQVTSAGAVTATSGTIGGWSLTNNALYRGSSSLGNANGLYFGASGISLSDKFKVTSAGALTATSGTVGGWSLTASALYRGSSSFGNASGLYFGSSGISLADKFKVTSAGALTATSGTVGGWSLTASAIYRGNSSYNNADSLYFGASGLSIKNKFRVDSAGNLYASSGRFTGDIYANKIVVGGDAGYVSGDQIGSGEVGTTNIGSGAVTTTNIGSGAVTTSKIGNGQVTTAKLDKVYATIGEFNDLKADVANIDRLLSGQATIYTLNVGQVNSDNIRAGSISIGSGSTWRTFMTGTIRDYYGNTQNVVTWV